MNESVVAGDTNWLNQFITAERLFRNHFTWNEVDPEKNDLDSLAKLSIFSQRVIWWIGSCGHKWDAMIQYRAGKGYSNCPICENKRFLAGVNDVASRCPELMDEWDYKVNPDPSTILTKVKTKYSWIGKHCGHSYVQSLQVRIAGQGCPICAGVLIVAGVNDLATIHPKLAVNITRLNTVDCTKLAWRSYQRVKLACDKCDTVFEDTIRRHHDKPGVFCFGCRKVKSRLELVVAAKLDKLGIKYVQQSKPLRRTDANGGLKPFEIDFILLDFKLAFEVQDYATHSRDRDDEPAQFRRSTSNQLKKGPEYHELKRKLAKEQLGIRLIDIWQDELFDGSWEKYLPSVCSKE